MTQPEPGPLLAAGRDAEIFEFGEGLVLRRSLDRRPLDAEAQVMTYVHERGYPVPAVHEVRAGGAEVVMDRVDGVTMLDALSRRPWRMGAMADMLADLHDRLHALPAPPWLPPAGDDGDTIVHLDLHPLNVLLSRQGPVVIDWANARRGHAATDAAETWVIMGVSEIPGNALERRLAAALRKRFVGRFLRHFDRDAMVERLPAVVERRARDRNVTDAERVAMRALLEREQREYAKRRRRDG